MTRPIPGAQTLRPIILWKSFSQQSLVLRLSSCVPFDSRACLEEHRGRRVHFLWVRRGNKGLKLANSFRDHVSVSRKRLRFMYGCRVRIFATVEHCSTPPDLRAVPVPCSLPCTHTRCVGHVQNFLSSPDSQPGKAFAQACLVRIFTLCLSCRLACLSRRADASTPAAPSACMRSP